MMQFGLSDKTLSTVRQLLSHYPAIEKAIIYGSRAKGNYKTGSDIDLTLTGDALDYRILSNIAEALDESPIPYTVDLSLFDHIDNQNLRTHIERVGKVLYQREMSTHSGVVRKAGWQTKKLGEVCEVVNGGTPKTGVKEYWEGDFQWITPAEMGKRGSPYVNETERQITDKGLKNSSAKLLPPKSVILSSRAPIGHLVINTEPMVTNQGCKGLIPNNSLHYKYLFYYLSSKVEMLNDLGSGATFKELSGGKLKEVPIPIAPLPEQQRIVAILDEAFEGIATATANAKKNLNNARELFESYLQSVFENKGEGWEEKSIGEICDLMTGGTPSSSKPEYYQHGTIKWLVSGDVNMEEITDCEGRITDLGFENSSTKYLPVNSVIIALNGQGKTRGTVAMLRTNATCNQSLVSIYPKDIHKLLPEYIFYNLKVRYQEIRKITGDSGNDRRGLNMPLIRSIKAPYPRSISQQKSFVNKFNILSNKTKKLESSYQQKLLALEELKKSLLDQAFSGKL